MSSTVSDERPPPGRITAARILARQYRPELEALGQDGRHVLAAVDGEVDVAGEQRVLDLLHEQPLAANLGQRRVGQPITRRLDDDDLAAGAGTLLDQRSNRVGLKQRQLAAARAQSECRHETMILLRASGAGLA
jgi:hypothetical protein